MQTVVAILATLLLCHLKSNRPTEATITISAIGKLFATGIISYSVLNVVNKSVLHHLGKYERWVEGVLGMGSCGC